MRNHFLRAAFKVPATATVTQPSSQTTGNNAFNTKTFSGLSFGTASSTRWIIALIQTPISTIPTNIGTGTIGGVSANVAYSSASSSTNFGLGIIYANVPTGTTGNVVINLTNNTSDASSRCILYAVSGRNYLSPVTFVDTGQASATARSTSLTVPRYGFNLNMFVAAANTSSTWGGTPAAPTLQDSENLLKSSAFVTNINTNNTYTVATSIAWFTGSVPARLISYSWNYT